MQRGLSPGEKLSSNSRVCEKEVSSTGSGGTDTCLLTGLRAVGGSSLEPLIPDNVDLKSKTSSYLTSKMGLFGNNRGIAIQEKQAMAKAIGKSKEQNRNALL